MAQGRRLGLLAPLAGVEHFEERGGAQLEEDRHLQRLEARAEEAHDVRVAQVAHELHLLHELGACRLGQTLAQQPLDGDA